MYVYIDAYILLIFVAFSFSLFPFIVNLHLFSFIHSQTHLGFRRWCVMLDNRNVGGNIEIPAV